MSQFANRLHPARVTLVPLILAMVVLLSREGLAAKRKPKVIEEAPVQRLTTLRASRPSFVVGGRGGQREVRYLSVEVANIGSVEATGIQVLLAGASALTFPLRGPKKLAAGARGVYVSTVRIPTGVSLQPHAIATCSTCRR
jgi:hypothetical protein